MMHEIVYRYVYVITGLLFLLLNALPAGASVGQASQRKNEGVVLMVASYNPDTKRMSEFINSFELQITNQKYGYQVLIEDMGCKGIDEATQWSNKLEQLLRRYQNANIKAIILLGQEAWSSFLSLETIPKNVPFFACFVSRNGIIIPKDSTNFQTWRPESVDMEALAKSRGMAGGVFNEYDVEKNINLIKNLYPETKNIAFVSDNTYGGLSLQALVRQEIKKFPELNLITIDSRDIGVDNVAKFVNELPKHTALLLGTWRVDRDGMYFLNSSIRSINSSRETIPTFSLTGTGMGSVAIGGYIPVYNVDAKIILDQIYDYHINGLDSTFFISLDGQYQFDEQIISKMGIKEYQLPHKSKIINRSDELIRQYRIYVIWSLGALCILILITLGLFSLYYHNKKLKDKLIENEKQLIIAKEHAEESGLLKSAFLANMSHEIRTPLNAIVGFSTLLCDESLPVESKNEFSQIIMTNSNLLLTLINDVLDISRLDTGKVVFDFRDEDIDAICSQVLFTTRHIHKPEVEYIFQPSTQPYILNTDMQRLSQVLINLITNASKFTESGSVKLGYEIHEDKDMVYFYVNDTGCGIPPQMQDKVFNRFEKLNEHKQGTGLGLAICAQIITRFGGKIWIDPNYTPGARFIFSHPINRNTSL